MNQDHQPMSIKETISSAFRLADDAAKLRDAMAKHLANIAPGRDHQVIHRCYRQLADLVVAFGHLEDQIAAMRAVGKYLT